jgi:hypothetical protein
MNRRVRVVAWHGWGSPLRRWPHGLAPARRSAAAGRDSGGFVQFNFEQADIRLVTQIVGRITGKKFVVPEGVTGKVTILTQGTHPGGGGLSALSEHAGSQRLHRGRARRRPPGGGAAGRPGAAGRGPASAAGWSPS